MGRAQYAPINRPRLRMAGKSIRRAFVRVQALLVVGGCVLVFLLNTSGIPTTPAASYRFEVVLHCDWGGPSDLALEGGSTPARSHASFMRTTSCFADLVLALTVIGRRAGRTIPDLQPLQRQPLPRASATRRASNFLMRRRSPGSMSCISRSTTYTCT